MANEKDPLQDMADQFKEMHEKLDKIAEASGETAKNTEPVAKAAKREISHAHRPNAPAPKVDLGKETRKEILGALQNIRSQIIISQQRESTASDVAAEHLAGGGSLVGAAGAAARFKIGKTKTALKRKFDPLNIVHRMTGGSKLATVLAGKLMFRSNKSIRAAAGLPEAVPGAAPGAPTPFMGAGATDSPSPSPVASNESLALLDKMSGTLTKILERLTDLNGSTQKIQESEQEDTKLEHQQTDYIEQMKDDSAEQYAKEHSEAPIQITKKGEPVKETKEENFFEMIMGKLKGIMGKVMPILGKVMSGLMSTLMKGLFSPLGLAIVGLVVAGVMLYRQWDNLKLSMSMLGDSIENLWMSIKDGVSSMGKWVAEAFTSISDSILNAGESVIEGVKKLNPFYTAPTEEEKIKKMKETAAGTGAAAGRAQRNLEKLNTEKMPAPGEVAAAVAKSAPTFSAKVPVDSKKSAAEALQRGDYDAKATGALMGTTPMQGTPEEKAVTGAVTQLVAKSYGDVWKDAQGKPLSPMTDTPENRERRVPEMVREATRALGNSLTAGAPTAVSMPNTVPGVQTITQAATAPAEVPTVAPQTGQMLSQANDIKQNAAMGPGPQASGGGATVINNIKNSTTTSTVHQNMPPARSGESSYLRSLDRHAAPA